MSDSLHIVCPHCQSINRVPANKLAEQPKPSQTLPFETEYLVLRLFDPMRPPRRGLSDLWR